MISTEVDLKIINDVARYVKSRHRNLDFEDIISMSWLPYLKALKSYKPELGDKSKHLYWKTYYGILDIIVAQDHLRSRRTTFEPLSPKYNIPDKHNYYALIETKIDITQLVNSQCVKREREIIALYCEGFTFKEIGNKYNLSECRICQIYNDCLRRLRAYLEQTGYRV